MIRHIDTNFLNSVTNFIRKRTFELLGLLLISLSAALLISFVTYTPSDPSFVYGEENTVIKNFFGIYGSIISDFLLQSFGLISFLILITFASWGLRLIMHKELKQIILKLFFLILYLILGCTFTYITFNNSFWLVDNGNSGFLGKIIYNYTFKSFTFIENEYSTFVLILFTSIFFILASEINIKKLLKFTVVFILKIFKRKKLT